MTFGTDLKDQIPSILNYVGDGIHSLTQFRNFIKDKTSIEREYAQKLENLTKKYKSNKKIVSTPGEQQDEWDWEDTSSTTSAAWCQLLDQTSLVAKSKFRLVDDINSLVVDSLRGVAARKDDARKKHAAFYQKLKNERDKTYGDKEKAKQLYDDSCVEIENLKAKLNKSGDAEKTQRQLDNAYLDRDNKKNLYLLSIGVANAERSKYFEEDIPILADHLQELDAARILSLKSILKTYIDLESKLLTTIQKCHDDSLVSIEKLDPVIDAGVFTRSALGNVDASERAANVQFTFMPWNGGANAADTIIDRDDSLVANDAAVIFLNNKLIKDRKQLDTLGDDLSKRSTELNKMESLVGSIPNQTSADYDKSKEKLMDIIRDITLLSTQKVRVKSEVDLIIQNIGDDGLRAQNHDFKSSSFTIPTSCDYCKTTIWGISNKGFTCRACGFNCHAKCEMKVAPNCSKVKGQINPQPVSSLSVPTLRSLRSNSFTESVRSIPNTVIPPPPRPVSMPGAELRALYTYQAQNTDELSISEGDLLHIVEHDDGTGWIKAQKGNEIGLIPANYIEYLDAPPEDEIVYDNDAPVISQPSIHDLPPSPSLSPAPIQVVALYDFEAVNAEELNIRQGDTILVTKKDDGGWWEGTLNGQTGIFPANYVSS
ncbi:uncharacterized protein EV154DRAFT_542366 [Mucor mucedo]|uniref:uncharacterized protein n=1 Tax=Mucor mucedo TaxID=29922 RepID=UPI00221FEC5C|nr:uncharacterized protein EV154DRAFT_542366 [Mucor mucedo]KAI7894598.1 hypothetical protein EV154DRAFT_542366 [Mucor mucedo]